MASKYMALRALLPWRKILLLCAKAFFSLLDAENLLAALFLDHKRVELLRRGRRGDGVVALDRCRVEQVIVFRSSSASIAHVLVDAGGRLRETVW